MENATDFICTRALISEPSLHRLSLNLKQESSCFYQLHVSIKKKKKTEVIISLPKQF